MHGLRQSLVKSSIVSGHMYWRNSLLMEGFDGHYVMGLGAIAVCLAGSWLAACVWFETMSSFLQHRVCLGNRCGSDLLQHEARSSPGVILCCRGRASSVLLYADLLCCAACALGMLTWVRPHTHN